MLGAAGGLGTFAVFEVLLIIAFCPMDANQWLRPSQPVLCASRRAIGETHVGGNPQRGVAMMVLKVMMIMMDGWRLQC